MNDIHMNASLLTLETILILIPCFTTVSYFHMCTLALLII